MEEPGPYQAAEGVGDWHTEEVGVARQQVHGSEEVGVARTADALPVAQHHARQVGQLRQQVVHLRKKRTVARSPQVVRWLEDVVLQRKRRTVAPQKKDGVHQDAAPGEWENCDC